MQHKLGRDQGGTDRASRINTSECRVADPAIRRRCAARPPLRGDMPRPLLLQDVHLNRGRSEEGCLCRLRGVGHFKPTHVCSNRAQGPARNPQPALIQPLHTVARVRSKGQCASEREEQGSVYVLCSTVPQERCVAGADVLQDGHMCCRSRCVAEADVLQEQKTKLRQA